MDALLLLTIYFLVVFYVLYQMALSLESKLEDKVVVHVKSDFWKEQTEAQLSCQPDARHISASAMEITVGKKKNIKRTLFSLLFAPDPKKSTGAARQTEPESISIQVMPLGKRPLNKIFNMTIIVSNGTTDTQLYINWDCSSLDMMGESKRVIRNTPHQSLDLSQPQIYSVVNPGKSLVSYINVEQNYSRKPDTNEVTQTSPLVDLKEQVAFLPGETAESENKFQSLYNLDLMVGLKARTASRNDTINLLLPFAFTLELAPEQIAFPLLRQLLKRYGRRNRPQRSFRFWGIPLKR